MQAPPCSEEKLKWRLEGKSDQKTLSMLPVSGKKGQILALFEPKRGSIIFKLDLSVYIQHEQAV